MCVLLINQPSKKIKRFVLLKPAPKGLEEKDVVKRSGGSEGNVTLQPRAGTWDNNATGKRRIPSQALAGDVTLDLDGVGRRASRPAGGSQAPVTGTEFDSRIHSLSASGSALRF